jgi:hypothetical protein
MNRAGRRRFSRDVLSVRTTALEVRRCESRPDCGIVRILTEVLKAQGRTIKNGELFVLLGENP